MKYAFIDLFCGAGGTSTGIENTENAFVYACVNHDKNAILSHKSNHPGALHFTEDIRTVSINKLIKKTNSIRKQYPGIKICLWASLECTNHSIAKGGMSRDADSRTLAEHLFRYFPIDFDMIFIENVKEFKDWGPLVHKQIDGESCYDKKGKAIMIPDKKYKGIDYNRWVNEVCQQGYKFEDTIINCADVGCPTTRKRLFIQFVKPELSIVWPKNTHSKDGSDGLQKWPAVGPLLALHDHGKSIFDKKLAPKTYVRILKGLKKFAVKQFIMKYYGTGDNVSMINDPCPTLTTKDRCYLTSAFLMSQYGKSIGKSIDDPAPTLTATPKESVISSHFLLDKQFNNTGKSLHDPSPTLIARQDKKPQYLVTAQFLMSTNFNNIGSDLDSPAPTQLASRKYDYLISTEGNSINRSIIDETDCPEVIELKMFMQDNSIMDIKMRALHIEEMLKIMTFPINYTLVGTKTEKKKYIGNSVPPKATTAIVNTSILRNVA